MPVYNAALYVRDAIASIRTQTYQDFEMVVIDGGSTDATTEVCRNTFDGDPRCRIITSRNTGIVGGLNDGFAVARCTDYIARMDADDISEPDRFRRQVEYLTRTATVSRSTGTRDRPGRHPYWSSSKTSRSHRNRVLLFRALGDAISPPSGYDTGVAAFEQVKRGMTRSSQGLRISIFILG